MGIDPTENLPNGLAGIDRVLADLDNGKELNMLMVRNLLVACRDALRELGNHCKELDISLTAAVTGELPERYTLNQLLLARRAKAYINWLNTTKDVRDKSRPEGSNDAMIPPSKRS
jgi:DNA primase